MDDVIGQSFGRIQLYAVQPDFDPVVELIRPIPTTGFLKVAKTAHCDLLLLRTDGGNRRALRTALSPDSGLLRRHMHPCIATYSRRPQAAGTKKALCCAD